VLGNTVAGKRGGHDTSRLTGAYGQASLLGAVERSKNVNSTQVLSILSVILLLVLILKIVYINGVDVLLGVRDEIESLRIDVSTEERGVLRPFHRSGSRLPPTRSDGKYFYFFLVSSFRDHSRISLRYDTVPVYGSISNESFRCNPIMPCPGPMGGRNDTSFRMTIRGDRGGGKKEGKYTGAQRTVGEAFAGRKDTMPRELEARTTSFGLGSRSCGNYT
jgi:hypothetical protein